MYLINSGDIVRIADTQCDMMIVGCADDEHAVPGAAPTWFCVWEVDNRLFEKVFSETDLVLVRKERRRIPRGGVLHFPSNDSGTGHEAQLA